MSARITTNADLVDRLMSRVAVQTSGCWEVSGHRMNKGYVQIACGRGRKMLAHRLAWFLRHGDPGEWCVLHRCDNPPCVNPAHLFLGTRADNNRDMWAKGRGNRERPRGEAAHHAKLSDRQVEEIRRLYAAGRYTQRQLAERFGIVQSHVWRLVHHLNRADR